MSFLYKKPLISLQWHILLGIIAAAAPVALAVWLWTYIFWSLWQLLSLTRSKFSHSIFTLAYVSGFEIAARAAGTSPYLPYEYAKYFFFGYLILLIFKFKAVRFNVGLFILILLLPALFFISNENYRVHLVNSYLGIFILGMMAMVCNKVSLKIEELRITLMMFLNGLISLLVLVILKTGNIDEIDFQLGALSTTTAGFGSNQVSTYLGVGVLISGLFWLMRWNSYKYKFLNLSLLAIFLIRGLLTFSRGGVIGAVTALLVFYILPKKSLSVRKISPVYILLFFSIATTVFFYVNTITDGILLERYRGETAATRMGAKDVSLETLTTGRTSLMLAEWNIFLDNPLFGVGPGNGFQERELAFGRKIATHTEFTRLMAEHGIFGLMVGLIFLFYPLLLYLKSKSSYQLFSMAFFTLAIFSSFHAAMRTTVTPFFWALGCMRFPEVPNLAISDQ